MCANGRGCEQEIRQEGGFVGDWVFARATDVVVEKNQNEELQWGHLWKSVRLMGAPLEVSAPDRGTCERVGVLKKTVLGIKHYPPSGA
jgi:hypothetical protein